MRTNESEAAAAARIGAGRAVRKRAELMGALRVCFARTETWQQAGKYVSALVSDVPKRNGWSIAQRAGDRSPDRMQRLLNRASWDAVEAMSQVRRFGAAGLAEAARRGGRRVLAATLSAHGSAAFRVHGSAWLGEHYLAVSPGAW